MHAVERIFRYLKSAHGKGLLFSKPDHFRVETYTDIDWAGSISKIHYMVLHNCGW